MTDHDWESVSHPEVAERLVLEPNCDHCPALCAARTEISWGNGPRDADVVVVGEAPAAGDPDGGPWAGGNHTGCAYTSRHSGRRIRDLFATLGYEDRAYYTNAVKCFPAAGVTADADGTVRNRDRLDGDPPTNREPTESERSTCRGHLLREIDIVSAEVVVTTGKHATESLLAAEGRALDGFLDTACEPIECGNLGVTLVPILHPSYQDVWLSRLGLSEGEYREKIAGLLPE